MPYKTTNELIKNCANESKPELYSQINFHDLIVKKLRHHKVCYKTLTKSASRKSQTPTSENEALENKSGLERVVNYIEDHVIGMHQTVSMKALTIICNKHQVEKLRSINIVLLLQKPLCSPFNLQYIVLRIKLENFL